MDRLYPDNPAVLGGGLGLRGGVRSGFLGLRQAAEGQTGCGIFLVAAMQRTPRTLFPAKRRFSFYNGPRCAYLSITPAKQALFPLATALLSVTGTNFSISPN